jgi:bacterial/archaeal transporter family protein
MKDWLLLTILTLLAWGFWAFLPKIAIRYIDPYSAMVYQALGGILVGFGVLIFMKFKVQFNIPGFSYGLAVGLLGFIGAFLYLLAVSKGPLSLVAPISAMYPIFAILLSLIFLNEAVSPRQGVGIALSVVAMYLIST